MLSLLVSALLASLAAPAAAAHGDIVQFDFGAYHRCAVTVEGAVQCLGESNVFGQIGNGTSGDAATYRPIAVIARGATKVVTGSFYSCAIVDTSLQCWGDIPVPPGGNALKPTTVIARGVADAAAADDRVCAIVTGSVQCVGMGGNSGSNKYQLAHPTPETVIEHGVTAIAAGNAHACAVVDGALLCWGQLPVNSGDKPVSFTRTPTPLRVIDHGVSAVASGANHTCAIVDGALWCWGDNDHGQVGIGVSVAHARTSAQAPAPKVAATFSDSEQRCFSNGYDPLQCWVGHPVKVIADGVSAVFAKGDTTCALVGDGLQCWGANAQGQLGIASGGADVLKPTLAITSGISYVALGGARTCARVNGALQCTRPCAVEHDTLKCPPNPGFDAHELAFGVSEPEARLGVWRGTIGTQPVMACLARPPLGETQYYYLHHGFSIGLSAVSTDGAIWVEGDAEKPKATWKLKPVSGDRLDGEWSDADGQRMLPIRLTRIAVAGDPGSGCESGNTALQIAFNAPRVAAQKLKVEESSDHFRTVSALDNHVSMVELPDGMQNANMFNKATRDWLRDQITEYYGCMLAAPNGGEFYEKLELDFHAGPWLVVQESYSIDCGGAHPNGGIAGFETWNLATGERVEPWTWIHGSKVDCNDCGYVAPADLNAIIIANAQRNKDDDECASWVNESNRYLLRPAEQGLIFSTSFAHVMQACDEDILVPYAKLHPFLSKAGKTAVQSLVDAAAAHPVKPPVAPADR
ncbi:hypothetical protein [Dokdonella soli]